MHSAANIDRNHKALSHPNLFLAFVIFETR